MDAHAITASALQANADLLTTIALALAALFGFSVNAYLVGGNYSRYIGMILTTIFGISVTFVFVNAYAVYHAIAVQADLSVFYLDKIEPLINYETRWVVVCSIL
jgi:heme/copper-type cytochrome/quinol oxidase subunit 3